MPLGISFPICRKGLGGSPISNNIYTIIRISNTRGSIKTLVLKMMKKVSFPRFRIGSSQSKREFTEAGVTLDHPAMSATSRSLTLNNYFSTAMPWMKWLTTLLVFAACWGVVILIAVSWFRIILPIALTFLAGYCITKTISLLLTFSG
jgi:hypothetical protein